jgi:hypothetical protein
MTIINPTSISGINSITSGTQNSIAFYDVNGGSNLSFLVGSASSTGTASQRLQVTGGAYVSGKIGVGSTNPGAGLEVNADASTSPAIFKINNTESARIDTSGRLLVGTSTARNVGLDFIYDAGAASVLVENAPDPGSISLVRNRNDGIGPYFRFGKSRGTSVGSNTAVQNGDGLGELQFCGADGTDMHSVGASIACLIDGTPGANDMPGRLVFSTTADGASSPNERMRIGNQGTTTVLPAANLNAIVARARDGASSGGPFLYLGYYSATDITNGTYCYSVATNGNVQNTNGSYTAISDARLKENIVDASSQWDDLKSIKIRNWNFKEETGHETHRQIGPIAQELEQVCPGLVFETPDRDTDGNETGEVTKGVNQSVLYMKAVKALQEAMERIEALEAKVAALEGA